MLSYLNKVYPLIMILSLGGCTTAMRLPNFNDSEMYMIECNGLSVPLLKCFEKAKEKCPDGYYLIDQKTGEIAIAGGVYVEDDKKNIQIRCNVPQKDTVIK
jgi:hypothetical protein